MPTPNPVVSRMSSAPSGRGSISRAGLPALTDFLRSAGAKDAFIEFSKNPVTRLVVSALRDIALNHRPPFAGDESCSVQYGITQGLGMAAQLIEDPSVLIPGVFDAPPERRPPETDFAFGPDDLVDQLP